MSRCLLFVMRGSRKSFQRRSNFLTFVFRWLGDRGSKYHYELAIIGSPAKRHLNGVSLAGRWWPNTECWLVRFVVLQVIRTNIAKKPYIFVIFQGVRTPCPPLDPHLTCHQTYKLSSFLTLFILVFCKQDHWQPVKTEMNCPVQCGISSAKLKQIFTIEIHRNLERSTCDPLKYKMGNAILILSTRMGNPSA